MMEVGSAEEAMAAGCDREFQGAVEYALEMVGEGQLVLKNKQLEAMEVLYKGQDVFLLLPTGYGKSICFECLPFLYDHKLGLTSPASKGQRTTVLVVSPLISLMVNQVHRLKQRGVSAAILSGNPGIDKEFLATIVAPGKYSLLFTAPEALIGNPKWRQCLLELGACGKLVGVVLDEAHCVSRWSRTFRPCYARVGEVRGIVPTGVPWLACTATATHVVKDDVCKLLDMKGCKVVCESPDRSNIYYEVYPKSDIECDFQGLVEELALKRINTNRVIVYCRSRNLCSDLYIHFLDKLGRLSYYPDGADEMSDNRLFGIYHANTPDHNKEVILRSMEQESGVVRVVFATVALGMGVNLAGVNRTIHYGAPSAIEDYYQELGRAGRSGAQAKSTIFWKPCEAPLRKNILSPRDAELAAVRHYLEDSDTCRRYQLLKYFDPSLISLLNERDPLLCCDVCTQLDII